MTAVVEQRLNDLERKLRALEAELDEVRSLAAPAPPPEPPVWVRPPAEPEPVAFSEPPAPPPVARPPRREPTFELPRLDFSKLLGAKSLALAGGIVTLLGVVFLFVLAVDRGWIGPGARLSLGATVAVLLFVGGVLIKHRLGYLYSALAAAGAGVAGGYATLLAATALYDLLPRVAALAIAAAIATAAVVVALRWSSELVAGLGLVGATLVPAALVFDTGLTPVGVAFVAVVFAATAVVSIERRWTALLFTGGVASAAQILGLVLTTRDSDPAAVALAATFALLFLLAGVGYAVRNPALSLAATTTGFILASAGIAFYSALLLFADESQSRGVALLVAAAAYACVGALLFRVRAYRDASALVAAVALAVAAVGVADLLSGATLTSVWAAEGVLLVWLARRVREIRFQLLGLGYLVLGVGHALAFDGRPALLFSFTTTPYDGIAPAAVLALALGLVAALLRPWRWRSIGERGAFRFLAPALGVLRRHQLRVRVTAAAASGVFAVYGLSLAILALFQLGAGGQEAFEHGHVAVSALWGLAALGALLVGIRRRSVPLEGAALAWFAVTVAKVLIFDASSLGGADYAYSFLAVATTLFVAAVAVEWLEAPETKFDVLAGLAAVVALALTGAAFLTLFDGRLLGGALLGMAALYLTTTAPFLRIRRDYSTLLWALALLVAACSEPLLVGGQWLAGIWAATAAAAAWVSVGLDERRFEAAAGAYLVAAAGLVLAVTAPPSDLFTVVEHPAAGAPSVVAVALAAGALARWSRSRLVGAVSLWSAGGLVLYALSLTIVELVEVVKPGTLASTFQSGHTAVSASWGMLGLLLLYLGLLRRRRPLQLGGFALFGVALGKLFFYDLAQLSSITRALSFLAVGAGLLVAGFFYQRLTAATR